MPAVVFRGIYVAHSMRQTVEWQIVTTTCHNNQHNFILFFYIRVQFDHISQINMVRAASKSNFNQFSSKSLSIHHGDKLA